MATNKPKIVPGQPLCCLSIGYADFLLPLPAAMKVAELMAKAVEVKETFAVLASTYTTHGPARVEVKVVQPHQVRTADAPTDSGDGDGGAGKVRRLGQQALALPMPKVR